MRFKAGHFRILQHTTKAIFGTRSLRDPARFTATRFARSGLGTRDSGLGTRDSGLGTRDSGLGTRGSGLGARGPGPGKSVRLLVRKERKGRRTEEHTSELQSLMRLSYAVFRLKKKKKQTI